jgi:hypothetical protein
VDITLTILVINMQLYISNIQGLFPKLVDLSTVGGFILLLRVGTLWRCSDDIFSEVLPLASDALLTTLHPLTENVQRSVDHYEISCLGASWGEIWAVWRKF